jgi:hypothetical protein
MQHLNGPISALIDRVPFKVSRKPSSSIPDYDPTQYYSYRTSIFCRSSTAFPSDSVIDQFFTSSMGSSIVRPKIFSAKVLNCSINSCPFLILREILPYFEISNLAFPSIKPRQKSLSFSSMITFSWYLMLLLMPYFSSLMRILSRNSDTASFCSSLCV